MSELNPTVAQVIAKYDVVVADVDGVITKGNEAIPGTSNAIRWIQQSGQQLLLSSNSMRRTPNIMAAVLARQGIHVPADDIVTASQVLSDLFSIGGALHNPLSRQAIAFGAAGLESLYQTNGVNLVHEPCDNADLVIIGAMDSATLRYETVVSALRALKCGATAIATSADLLVPSEPGDLPGSGLLTRYFYDVAKRYDAPFKWIGKPHSPYFDAVRSKLVDLGSKVLFVGDTIDSDIKGANETGFDSLLVLSGNTTEQQLANSNVKPTWVAQKMNLQVGVQHG